MADTTTQQQIVREAPEIEAYKLELMRQARDIATQEGFAQQIPGYQVAGFSPAQMAAMSAAQQQGVGAFMPYVTAANQGIAGGMGMTREAADLLRGADTRAQFGDAAAAMGQAGAAAAGMTGGIGQINTGLGYMDLAGQRAMQADTTGRFGGAYRDIGTGINALATSQNMAARSSQADLMPATAAIGQGMMGLSDAQRMAMRTAGADFSGSQAYLGAAGQQAAASAYQPGFMTAQQALQQGIGGIGAGTQGYDPSRAQAFMDPYRQQVIDESMRQIERQGQIAQQGLSSQAVRAGAFGGEREGVQRAELQRGLLEQKSNTIANLLSQGYSQAQANSMASFEQQQQRALQGAQATGQLGAQAGQIAAQQAGVQQGAAGQIANIGQTVGQQAAQQAQLGQSAAGLYGNLSQQQIAAGQGLGQLGVQQAQLGQSAAGLYQQAAQGYGNLASQQGALAGQESNIQQNIANLLMQQGAGRTSAAQALAGIYGQQSGMFQNIGQGIGSLAGQQFGIGQQMASGLGQMGAQYGQQGLQQLGIGQAAQGMQQSDINFLYNTGQAQQAYQQQVLDAQRATQMQQLYAPYQQAAFLSDIYRGAPSTQMATSAVSQPSASPFQQAAGIGLAGLTAAAGAAKVGLL
jgi:hypothetical protein